MLYSKEINITPIFNSEILQINLSRKHFTFPEKAYLGDEIEKYIGNINYPHVQEILNEYFDQINKAEADDK